jgi:hypothetical protein
VNRPIQIIPVSVLDEVAHASLIYHWPNRNNCSLVECFFVVDIDDVGQLANIGANNYSVTQGFDHVLAFFRAFFLTAVQPPYRFVYHTQGQAQFVSLHYVPRTNRSCAC